MRGNRLAQCELPWLWHQGDVGLTSDFDLNSLCDAGYLTQTHSTTLL